jgi:zinc transport system substrate-binding protein
MRRLIAVLGTLAALAPVGAVAACDGSPSAARGDGRLDVVAAFYPLQFVAERVGGDRVRVTNLVKPGAEPHDLELRPSQLTQIATADLVLYLHGFQPAVDAAVTEQAPKTALDGTDGQQLRDAPSGGEASKPGDRDPHIWLDPTRLASVADAVAGRLAAKDPAHAADFRTRAGGLRVELDALDRQYATGLANCQRHELVTSHAAFGYLAARYHLEQLPITGLSPEDEPTPGHLAEVATLARAKGVTTIFFETLVSPKIAETLAREIGARAEVLDPIEGIEPGSTADYLSVMRDNLGKLRTALGCS